MTKLRAAIDKKVEWYNSLIVQAKSDKAGALLLREKKRWLCRNDLYYLGLTCGYKEWKPGMSAGFVEHFHKQFCEEVSLLNWKLVQLGMFAPSEDMLKPGEVVGSYNELGKNRRLFEKFRSAYKSTIVTKLHILQLLLNFPDIHIAITHNTQENASDLLVNIKWLFKHTDLNRLFPECVPRTKDWGNTLGFSVANRQEHIMTGDNVEAFGIGTEVVGRKFHVFKIDDFVTDKSVTTEEQLRQSIAYVESHKSLFVNPSLVIEDYSVTKYHFADATTYLENDQDVESHITPLLKEDKDGVIPWNGKQYTCILPEHFSPEGIGKAGVSGLMKDEAQFNLQYLLNPSNPKKIKFTEDMIQTFEVLPQGLTYYLVVDPADSEEKRACYTAMKVIGIDKELNWYWVDGAFDKIDDKDRIDTAIGLATKWRVYEVLWENLSFGRTDCRNFDRASRDVPSHKRTWGAVRTINASRSSKDDRILGLNNLYARHKIFWAKTMMYYSRFEGKIIDIIKAQEYEFKSFPLCSHKDLLDAESFLLQVDLIPGDVSKETVEPSRFAHIKDKNQRGNTELFWHEWDEWKNNGYRSSDELVGAEDYL